MKLTDFLPPIFTFICNLPANDIQVYTANNIISFFQWDLGLKKIYGCIWDLTLFHVTPVANLFYIGGG